MPYMLRRGITCLDWWAWKPESQARDKFHAFFVVMTFISNNLDMDDENMIFETMPDPIGFRFELV